MAIVRAHVALCYLATLYCGQRTFATGAVRWGAGAVVACALGMGSKEAMVMAPVVVLLYDRIFAAGSFLRAIALRRGFYAGLAATWYIVIPVAGQPPRRFDRPESIDHCRALCV